jgi:hypothetical protein
VPHDRRAVVAGAPRYEEGGYGTRKPTSTGTQNERHGGQARKDCSVCSRPPRRRLLPAQLALAVNEIVLRSFQHYPPNSWRKQPVGSFTAFVQDD